MEFACALMRTVRLLVITVIASTLVISWGALADAATCYTCHAAVGQSSDIRPVDAAYRNLSTGGFKGNHQTHLGATSQMSACAKCHDTAAGSYPTTHRNGSIEMGVNINASPATGAYSKGPSFTQSGNPALGTCSNVNCHFEKMTPTWGEATFNYPADCDKCHETPPSSIDPGSHAKHDTYYPGTTNCQKCHANHTTFAHATSAGRNLVVSFATAPNNGSGVYSGAVNDYLPSQNNTFGSCSVLYCHSPGTKASSYDPPNTTPVTWGNSLNCKGCHKAEAFSGAEMSTGSHQSHVQNALGYTTIKCVTCHAVTANANMTISDFTKHVNKFVDVAFNNTSSATNGLYTGAPATKATPSSRAPGSAPGTCQNVYCHSAGQHSDGTALIAGDYTTPVWSGNPSSGKCGTCHGVTGSTDHGGFPATNGSLIASGKHTKHLSFTYGISDNDMRCAICHAYDKTAFATSSASCGTTCHGSSPNNTGAEHANYEINVNIANYVGAAATYSGTTKPGDGYGSCSSVYCHSDGQATPAFAPAVSWSGAALSCTSCHGGATVNSPGGTALSGKHAAHVNPAVNNELGTGNGFGCVECHQKTVISNTTLNATTGTTAHVNKFVDYTGLRAGGPSRYNSATKQCSNFYCHSNAKAGTTVAEFKNPPVWSSASTLGCNGCHGNNTVLPDGANPTNANLGQPNYANGGAGLASANSHKKHVSEAGMSNSTGCYNCHAKTVDKFVSATAATTAATTALQLPCQNG